MYASRTQLTAAGPEISRFIAGYWRVNQWQLSDQALLNFINQTLELGISTVDHAMVYRSEAPFGRALALQPALRDQLQIITKFGIRPKGFGELGARQINHYDSSSTAIVESVDASLRDLQTDYIDVLLIHRPDYLMNAHEVVAAFESLKNSGKVRYFGVSNFNNDQFTWLQAVLQKSLGIELVTNQIEFSPLHLDPLDDGTFEHCQLHGYQPMLWSCLAGGRLINENTERQRNIITALRTVADEWQQEHIETIVYAWCMALPCAPAPLLGTQNLERVKIALSAEDISLNREQWYRIWEASAGHPVP